MIVLFDGEKVQPTSYNFGEEDEIGLATGFRLGYKKDLVYVMLVIRLG